MNFQNILTNLSETDPEIFERTSERRSVIKNWSKGIALTALPLALGSLFKKAYGKNTGLITDTLNFALTLEYLEAEFYQTALNSSGLIPSGAPTGAIQTIYDHEAAHVTFLQQVITAAGETPVAKPTFDFSGGNGSGSGPFLTAFSDYDLFLAVAQTFEDTGVRAYKGQAANLITDNVALEAALNIHSVEARHASHIRSMRKARGASVKPWITLNQSGISNSAVQPSYDGEEITSQAGIEITNINGENISNATASESFDEPLTTQQVLAIVDPFIV